MMFKCPRAKPLQTFDWLYEEYTNYESVCLQDTLEVNMRVILKKNRIHKYQPDTNIYNSALNSLLDKQ